jgi:lipid II:glycine glycyltransferase (peptidoglycan interpeptide bridge formation enzyme)
LGIVPGPGLATTIIDQVVELNLSEEELFAGLEESCRRAVRKGLKAGLSAVDLSGDPRCLDEYWRLAVLSAQRTGESLPDRSYYENIRSAFLPRNAFSATFVTLGEEFVAAAILLRDKHACHFFSGVSDPAYLGSRVNDVLHWNAMVYAKQRGDRFYRLGPYFPSLPRDWPVEKVTRFKSKFGARPFSIIQGSKFLKPQRYAKLAQDHVARLCAEL